MTDITVKIRFFGAFRKYGDGAVVRLPKGSSVADVKKSLFRVLTERDAAFSDGLLIDDSAMANDNAIVPSDTVFETDATLAILPPVCGG